MDSSWICTRVFGKIAVILPVIRKYAHTFAIVMTSPIVISERSDSEGHRHSAKAEKSVTLSSTEKTVIQAKINNPKQVQVCRDDSSWRYRE